MFETLFQCGFASAAPAVPHHDNFGDFELGDGEFERSRHAVSSPAQLKRRHQIGDIADNEHFSG